MFSRVCVCVCFFFQAEDGIRDLVRSRGLGDVYKRQVYNVTSFNPTAREIFEITKKAFPDARIDFEVDQRRQKIVDTWPADVDDSAARQDWGWQPDFDQERAFNEYLIPAIRKQYMETENH